MTRELTIGELATRSGVATSALRFYERQGLIAARRTEGNQRRYPSVTLRRVAVIQAGKAAGIALDEIRAALDTLPPGKSPTKRDWQRFSRRWSKDLGERIETLEALRTRLTTCIGCGCLSLMTCDLLNPGDEAARRGPGAHFLRKPPDADNPYQAPHPPHEARPARRSARKAPFCGAFEEPSDGHEPSTPP